MVLLRYFAYILALSVALAGRVSGQEKEDAFQPINQPSPVALIGARCVFCHGPAVMLSLSRRLLDETGLKALDVFLARHHAPDKEARDAIVQFLSNPFGVSN